jgi:hypothetical protein
VLELLAARDRAQRSCDATQVSATLDLQTTPPEFRERELTLGRIVCERQATPPVRQLVTVSGGAGSDLGLVVATLQETDDQARTRLVRYFVNFVGATRLSEPHLDRLGPVRTRAGNGFEIRHRDMDADQAAATERIATDAITSLVARLGEAYRLQRPFTITLAPTTVAGLPAVASGFVNDRDITLLSSQSMVVDAGPGSEWAKRVVTHEVAHILLFQRGRGAWLLVEGIPLWLTDDRRQPELDRLVASNALWELGHLVEGPRDLAEFFAGYAQASSFVRYLAATYGDRAVIAAWEAGRTMPFEQAFRIAFGVAAADAHAVWRASLRPAAARLDGLRPAA